MKMDFTNKKWYFALAFLVFLGSCGQKEKENNSEDFSKAEEDLKNQITGMAYKIPPPTEIPYLMSSIGAEFNPGLVNDRKKSEGYAANNDKAALNLGVYTADIGYLTSYEKTQESIDYINTCKTLADNLGVLGTFDIDMLKKFEASVSNKDSMASLLNTTITKADKYLKDGNRNKLAALMLTGGFIEGMYIATGLVKTYPKDLLPKDSRNLILSPLIKKIMDQKASVDEVVKMLQSVEKGEPIDGLLTDLTALQASYNALNIEDKLSANKASELLTDKNLVDITAVVEKIRNSITQ